MLEKTAQTTNVFLTLIPPVETARTTVRAIVTGGIPTGCFLAGLHLRWWRGLLVASRWLLSIRLVLLLLLLLLWIAVRVGWWCTR